MQKGSEKAPVGLSGNIYKIKSKVQRLRASCEDSGGNPFKGYEIVSAIVKAIEKLHWQLFVKLTTLQSKITDLIRDIFNWSNMFGMQAKLIYDQESVTDTNYSCRTLKFELIRTNSLNKAVARNKYEF